MTPKTVNKDTHDSVGGKTETWLWMLIISYQFSMHIKLTLFWKLMVWCLVTQRHCVLFFESSVFSVHMFCSPTDSFFRSSCRGHWHFYSVLFALWKWAGKMDNTHVSSSKTKRWIYWHINIPFICSIYKV